MCLLGPVAQQVTSSPQAVTGSGGLSSNPSAATSLCGQVCCLAFLDLSFLICKMGIFSSYRVSGSVQDDQGKALRVHQINASPQTWLDSPLIMPGSSCIGPE